MYHISIDKALEILAENDVQPNDKTVHKFKTVITDHPQLNVDNFTEAIKSAKGRKYESNNRTLRKIINILYSMGVGYVPKESSSSIPK